MNEKDLRAWVLYDAQCPMCSNMANAAKNLTTGQSLGFASLHEDWVKEKVKDVKDPLNEMLILMSDGNIIGGEEAMVHLARKIWFTRPLYWIYLFPGMKFIYKHVYAFIAKNRYCISKTCRIKAVGSMK